MSKASDLDYTIHHLCIYDKDPRDHMWPYLRWHHGVTGFFTGDTFHIADEGHADYTFLGCGGRSFQIQLEAPPYQFKYEQNWYTKHGNGYNHICWIVNNAREAYEQLQSDGATVMQEFQPFPTYDGFVMADPEGRWIEIMEYTHDRFRVQEFTNQPAGECGLRMIGFREIVNDLEAMSDWYQQALDVRPLASHRNGAGGFVQLSDRFHDARERNTIMMLSSARSDEEKAVLAATGPYISAIIYEAQDLEQAFEDGKWAGMLAESAPEVDEWTGVRTALLREPSGNLIELRETQAPDMT